MPPSETTKLLPSTMEYEEENNNSSAKKKNVAAAASGGGGGGGGSWSMVSTIFLSIQALLLAFFIPGTKYSDEPYDVKEYIAFRDIMAMLLLGFGYLMTFLKNYGLGAVGFTMMLSILSMELNIVVELFVRFISSGKKSGNDDTDTVSWPMPVSMATLIDSEFAAATLMITFGALIGRATPLQMMIICIGQSFFYAFNKVVLVLGVIGAEDVGGSMTIHMFGAYFGLAASYAMGPASEEEELEDAPDKVSDILALIGTTILWVFWPSFVGATETGVLENEQRCVVNTILSLMASTTVTFYLSQRMNHGKFDPVHVANSTLAGGVAIGSAGRLNIGPGMAIVTGLLSGTASVCGYQYSSPYLQSKFGLYDTCGVGNLHGYPSLVGALLSVIFVSIDSEADFLTDSGYHSQMLRQIGGIGATLVVSIASGYGTGLVALKVHHQKGDYHPGRCYLDGEWWHLEY